VGSQEWGGKDGGNWKNMLQPKKIFEGKAGKMGLLGVPAITTSGVEFAHGSGQGKKYFEGGDGTLGGRTHLT